MHAPGDVFFPAQVRSAQRGSMIALPKEVSTIVKTVTACLYGDHSLLMVEKGRLHTRIREYAIVGGTNYIIGPAAYTPQQASISSIDRHACLLDKK
jgi:hypothetical protein